MLRSGWYEQSVCANGREDRSGIAEANDPASFRHTAWVEGAVEAPFGLGTWQVLATLESRDCQTGASALNEKVDALDLTHDDASPPSFTPGSSAVNTMPAAFKVRS